MKELNDRLLSAVSGGTGTSSMGFGSIVGIGQVLIADSIIYGGVNVISNITVVMLNLNITVNAGGPKLCMPKYCLPKMGKHCGFLKRC